MPPKRSAIARSTKQAKRRREERASETSKQRKTSLHPSVIIGKMDKKCMYCGAQKFKNETPGMCCAGGKVKLPDLRSPPEPLLTLVPAVGPTFVLMYNNARTHRADIVDDYLKRRDCVYAVSSRFPPPATLIELEIALQEEWRLLNSAVVYHLIESMVRR
ncbi:uncharacterized protein TNCV_2637201 [Trichonephila clavipes]|uniref:Tc1-like transposase DDE domain-containing protein n=1 Tax=Trichonephila clavipes TaxID=2585209 RepID=A0A8X6R2S5_TRICX|nr:uncharacterized protein TNCV_2637201 [Trichonephila clavipes]